MPMSNEWHLPSTEHHCPCIDCLIARSSIGAGLADIARRGITAHAKDLERKQRRRRRPGRCGVP